jgi:hypothetical protein
MTKNCFEEWGRHALNGLDVKIIDDDLAAARQLEKIWQRTPRPSRLTPEAMIVITERIRANERNLKLTDR